MRRSLQGFLLLLGAVACAAGLLTVLTGASTITGAGAASASLDNELRFYAAWYVAAGVFILRAARAPESQRVVLVAVAAAFGLAATARVLSWIQVGRPSAVAVALLAVEYVIALGLPPWQAAVARHAGGASSR